MAKYLLLKHYRGAPASVNDVPMDQWTPAEVEAHVQYMRDLAARVPCYVLELSEDPLLVAGLLRDLLAGRDPSVDDTDG